MELQVSAGVGVGFSRAARAVAELGAVDRSQTKLRRERVERVRETLSTWTVELDAIMETARHWNETSNVAAEIERAAQLAPEERREILPTVQAFLEQTTSTAEVVANALAFVSSLREMVSLTIGEDVVEVAAVEREVETIRAALLRAADVTDDAIDIALASVARLDPDNDGEAISLAALEAKLAGAA